MSKGLLNTLKKKLNNQYASIVSDGLFTDNCNYIDTGSYILNALVSGSIFGGIPSNTVTMLAGEPSVGKTYFLLSFIKNFLDSDPEASVIYFETESALKQKHFISRGIDTERVLIVPINTIEEFRKQSYTAIDSYLEQYPDKNQRPKIFVCLDSLGNLTTIKEVSDIEKDSNTVDFTKSKTIRSAFRVLTLKCGLNDIPLVVTNHTYSTMDMYKPDAIAGGKGGIYSSSTVLKLSKSPLKENGEVHGNIVRVVSEKSRDSKEKQKIETLIDFQSGLDRYYGLLDVAVEGGIFEYTGRQYIFNDKKYYAKFINENPKEFYTDEILQKIDDYCKKKFGYGSNLTNIVLDSNEEE